MARATLKALDVVATTVTSIADLESEAAAFDAVLVGSPADEDPALAAQTLADMLPAGVRIVRLGRHGEAGRRRYDAWIPRPVRRSALEGALVVEEGDSPAQAAVTAQGSSSPDAQTDGARTTPALASRQADSMPRVLLVEDNPVNQRVALRMLERIGIQADLAKDGGEAIEAAAGNEYDCILMDVQMPGIDGLEATRRIRQDRGPTRRPRIVAMTATATTEDKQECLAAGMDGYISKPVRMEELKSEVMPSDAV
ncbi:MAG: response regulator [Rhodothermales bacterium]|nr:response regulator [Rhodothermales bacterium]